MSTATGHAVYCLIIMTPFLEMSGISALQSSITPPPDSIRSFAINHYFLPESVGSSERGKGISRKLKISLQIQQYPESYSMAQQP